VPRLTRRHGDTRSARDVDDMAQRSTHGSALVFCEAKSPWIQHLLRSKLYPVDLQRLLAGLTSSDDLCDFLKHAGMKDVECINLAHKKSKVFKWELLTGVAKNGGI